MTLPGIPYPLFVLDEIQRAYESRVPLKVIAAELGVAMKTVSSLAYARRWKRKRVVWSLSPAARNAMAYRARWAHPHPRQQDQEIAARAA